MIHRFLAKQLLEEVKKIKKNQDVFLIEGARQVGKTTLIRLVLKESKIPHIEINLEEKGRFARQIDECEEFADFCQLLELELEFEPGSGKILFIDEAQESRQLGHFVRFMKEKWQNTLVILSGSSMARIFRETVRYPVGRVKHFLLTPFSFEEFLKAHPKQSLEKSFQKISFKNPPNKIFHDKLLEVFEDYMNIGGLPEVVVDFFAERNWKETRENIFYGYLNDFKRVYGEEFLSYFEACLMSTAQLLGSPFKNSQVSRLLDGGKNQTIIQTLSQLESWKMVYRADQRGPKAEAQFHPKRYLFDHGIAKILRERARNALSLGSQHAARDPLGGFLENMVATALIQKSPLNPLTGWKKSSSGTEVDFVQIEAQSPIPIEVKATTQLKDSHLHGVRDFMKINGSPYGIVVSLAPLEMRELSKGEVVYNLPIYLFGKVGSSSLFKN